IPGQCPHAAQARTVARDGGKPAGNQRRSLIPASPHHIRQRPLLRPLSYLHAGSPTQQAVVERSCQPQQKRGGPYGPPLRTASPCFDGSEALGVLHVNEATDIKATVVREARVRCR